MTSRRVYTLQADLVRIPRAPGGIGRGNRPVPIPADSAENRPVPGADAGIVRTLLRSAQSHHCQCHKPLSQTVYKEELCI